MNMTELKKYIESGKLDEKLVLLYGEKSLDAQRKRWMGAVDGFIATYGDLEGARAFSVPGRTEVSGNHTDHNCGKVLAASVDLDIIAIVTPCDGVIELKSEGFDKNEVNLANIAPGVYPNFSSTALLAGVYDGFVKAGHPVGGFKAYTTNSVLKGSGLSSSAAFEVMGGYILSELYGGNVSAVEIAKIAQYSENVFFGKPCGLMDQTACAVGGFIAIDFEDPKNPIVNKISFDLAGEGYALCIVNTGGNHADLNDDHASIPYEMKSVAAHFGKTHLRGITKEELIAAAPELRKTTGDRALMRAFHFVCENERVEELSKALDDGNLEAFFAGIKASGNSSYKYLQNVFTVKNVSEQGISLATMFAESFLASCTRPCACRVHGGGFAGTIQAFVPTENAADFEAYMNGIFGEGACHILRIRGEGAYTLV